MNKVYETSVVAVVLLTLLFDSFVLGTVVGTHFHASYDWAATTCADLTLGGPGSVPGAGSRTASLIETTNTVIGKWIDADGGDLTNNGAFLYELESGE